MFIWGAPKRGLGVNMWNHGPNNYPQQGRAYAITSVCISFCLYVEPRAKSYECIYMTFLPKIGFRPVSRWFHFGGDLDWHSLQCHLEVIVAQQGYFDITSTVAQKKTVIRPKLLHNTNRMFSPMAPFSMTLEHVSRSNQETIMWLREKLFLRREIYVCGSGHQQRCPICFPREIFPREILALAEVAFSECSL